MIPVQSPLSTFNQPVGVYKKVNIPENRSLESVLADAVLVMSKPKIKLIVTGNELRGVRKPLNSGAVSERNWQMIQTYEDR